jgi:nickel-dependent lactate racemase
VEGLRTGDRVVLLPHGLRDARVIARDEPPALADPAAALRDAVRRPVAGPPLASFLEGKRDVVVVLPDATRPLPTALVEALIDEIGRPVAVRIANGTHRRTTAAERVALLGRHAGLEHGDRSSEDASAHATLAGLDARIDARAARADALICLGPASFHYLAGFGGAGKLVAPGLADRATADRVHSACLAPEGGRHPCARSGLLDGNPLQARIAEICRAAPPQLHAIVVLDSAGRPVAIRAGEREAAQGAAVAILRDGWSVEVERAPVVVASAGGRPHDVDFVQGHKALEAAAAVVAPGGTVVLVASCAEGISARHRAFLDANPSAAAMERALRARFDIAGHTLWAAREKAERIRTIAVTDMDPALVRALGMEPARTIDEALAGLDLSRAAILPFGARFLPLARSG